jgi:thiol-disulfide isomerase/thioredoxin
MFKATLLVALAFLVIASDAYADWVVVDKGTWPESWPAQLDPLRKQCRSLQGSALSLTFYEIPFAKREEFEAAWPHILKVATKGVPITLLRGPHEYLGTLKAGVRIWHPAHQTRNIWLVVDGETIDLNRIPLPKDTLIIDERFKDKENKPATGLVPRADSTPLLRSDGSTVRRVEKDQDGNITELLLNDLQLSPRDIEELAMLVHLRRLVLRQTNFADKDLPCLSGCTLLEHLDLSRTEVTDAAVDHILALKKLKSLCLGNVNISADAIARLRNGLHSRGQVVRLGYSGREQGEKAVSTTTSNADKLKANPDDKEALTQYVREMERSIKFLADQDAAAPAQKKLDELKSLLNSLKPSTPEGQQRLDRTKGLLGRLEADVELARTSLVELESNLDTNPRDQKTLNRYIAKGLRHVYRVMRSNPDQAEVRIRAIRERLAKVRESADKGLHQQLDQLDQHLAAYDKSIASSRDLLALVGKDAFPLKVEAWINGAPLTDADLKGKVVLLDFWAVWCGPCIATFPELRKWHEKYGNKGLVIIGLTDYFNYAWNEEAGRAAKSTLKVTLEQEQAMLRKFAAHHDVPFRFGIHTGIRSLDGELAKYYKVTGLPHVVIIDRAGKIRLLREGSGEQNAKDITELLEKLLGTAPAEAHLDDR